MVNGRNVKPDQDLLLLLDPDPLRAAHEYALLLRRLIKFFEWRRCEWPEDLADEVLLRGMKRLQEGVTLTATPVQYFFGVAKHVVLESRRPAKIDRIIERYAEAPDDVPGGDSLGAIEAKICLRQILSKLSPEDRELLMRYHLGNRKELQEELGVTRGALRVRICRLHKQIREAFGEAARLRRMK